MLRVRHPHSAMIVPSSTSARRTAERKGEEVSEPIGEKSASETEPRPLYRIPIAGLAILEEVRARPQKEVLFHYTTRPGLLGILESKEFWASNARYLNDARELSTAEEIVFQRITDHDFAPDSPEANLFQAIKRSYHLLAPDFDAFVFSVSENDDLLSQWRAYSHAGDGYSIGIEVSGLVSLEDSGLVYLSRCYYSADDHQRLISVVIEDAVRRLNEGLSSGSPDAQKDALGAFMGGLQFVAPMIKHEKFAEEREWRIIVPFANVWSPGVCFRHSGRLLVPYVPIGFHGLTLIKQVRIGPTPHPDLEERATSGLLTLSGFPKAIIEVSKVPYRDW
jgi:hypothetical protein